MFVQMPFFLNNMILIMVLRISLSPLFCMIMNNQNGMTALYISAEGGHTDIIKLLLDKRANTEAIDNVSHHAYILLLVIELNIR